MKYQIVHNFLKKFTQVEKYRNFEHFLEAIRKKIVKSVHNSEPRCYNEIIIQNNKR